MKHMRCYDMTKGEHFESFSLGYKFIRQLVFYSCYRPGDEFL